MHQVTSSPTSPTGTASGTPTLTSLSIQVFTTCCQCRARKVAPDDSHCCTVFPTQIHLLSRRSLSRSCAVSSTLPDPKFPDSRRITVPRIARIGMTSRFNTDLFVSTWKRSHFLEPSLWMILSPTRTD